MASENTRLIKQAQGLEERYRSTLDSMLEGYQIIGYDWRFLYVNDAAARHWRQAKEELLGHTIMERHPGIEHTEVFAALQRCMEKRIPHRMEGEFTFPDGSKGWFEFSIQPVPEGIFVTSQDITERKRAEEALQQSEQKLRITLESIADGVAVTDLGLNIVDVNQAGLRLFGYSHKQEIIGRNGLELVSVKCHARAMEDMSRTLQTGNSGTLEYTFVAKDGREFAAEYNVAVVRDAFGNPVGFVGTMKDITERKRAEERLTRLSRALEMATDSIVISDLDARIIDVNEATLRMYGTADSEELVGKSSFDLIAPGDRERALAGMKELLEKGYIEGREYHVITKDGARILVEMNCGIMKDAQGKVAGFVATSRDITERKKAEEALRESEERYRALVDTAGKAGVGIAIFQDTEDTEGAIVFVNEEFATMQGYSREEVLLKPLSDFISPDFIATTKDRYRRRQSGEDVPSYYELTAKRKDGTPLPLAIAAGIITYRGKVATVVYLIHHRAQAGRPILQGIIRQLSDWHVYCAGGKVSTRQPPIPETHRLHQR
jgi:PAS domain S-box-containing protein